MDDQVFEFNTMTISVHANSDTTDFFVKKEIYDTVEIGSWFTFGTTMGTFHEPYKRLTDK